MIRILFFGDIVGRVGRHAVRTALPGLRKKFAPDLVAANCENAAHGVGITTKVVAELFALGIDFMTTGNHVYDKPEHVEEIFSRFDGRIIRPANFEGQYAGRGWAEVKLGARKILFVNIHAQVFMERQFDGMISSPFKSIDEILQNTPKSDIIIVDFHSEATSEKRGFGLYLDGKVTAVLGTHTHVQTADAQVLAGGTAYISDLGMCGAANSVLGVKKDLALKRFLTGEKTPLEGEENGSAEIGYVVIDIDEATGKAKSIESHLDIIEMP